MIILDAFKVFFFWPYFILTILIYGIGGFFLGLSNKPLGRRAIGWWGDSFFWAMGLKLVVRGRENLQDLGEGALLVSNHASQLDIPLISRAALPKPLTWISKKSLMYVPIYGLNLLLMHILVDRGDPESARKMLVDSQKRLLQKETLVIFPEGTRNTSEGPLLPFKRGAFLLAATSKAPIVPVAVKGSKELWPRGCWIPKSGQVTITFCPVINVQKGEKLQDISDRVEAAIRQALAES